MRISTIIPVYNVFEFLSQAIGSVVEQTENRADVIVVDDGSEEVSAAEIRAICASFPGVRLLTQTHSGAPRARDYGLAHAVGDFVVFLDADDTLAPGAFDFYRHAIDASPSADVVYGLTQWIDSEGNVKEDAAPPKAWRVSGFQVFEHLIERRAPFCIGSYCARREALRALPTGGYRLTLSYEWWQWCHLAYDHKILFAGDQTVLFRRRHDRRISHGWLKNPELLLEACEAIFGEKKFQEKIGIEELQSRKEQCQSRIHAYLASAFAAENNQNRAQYHLKQISHPITTLID